MKKTKKKKIKKGYQCPHCKKWQTAIIQWQTQSAMYEYDFITQNWELKETEGGDHENWCCPECDYTLDGELNNKIIEQIF